MRTIRFLIGLSIMSTFTPGCGHLGTGNEARRAPGAVETPPSLARSIHEKHPAGNFADLRALLTSKKAGAGMDVARALQLMKAEPRFSPLFSSYTLARESRSLQSATASAPRALLFGDDGRLMVTFNAKNAATGGNSLETVEYDAGARALKYREVLFKSELVGAGAAELKKAGGSFRALPARVLDHGFLYSSADDIEFEDQNIVISKPNPAKCMQCHQTNARYPDVARYNWEGYSVWKGFYGEDNDTLVSAEISANEENPDREIDYDEPARAYADYLKATAKDPRYSTLQRSATFPFRAKLTLGNFAERPNLRLTKIMGIYQGEVYAGILERELAPAQGDEFLRRLFCEGDHEALKIYGDYLPEHLDLLGEPSDMAKYLAKKLNIKPKYDLGGAPVFFQEIDKEKGLIKMEFRHMVAAIYAIDLLRARGRRMPTEFNPPRPLRELAGLGPALTELLPLYFGFVSRPDEERRAICASLR